MSDNIYKPRWNTQLSEEYSDGTILWRYLTFDKFIKLFSQNGIYFRKLSKFEDPYEGAPSVKYFQESKDVASMYNPNPEKYLNFISGFRNKIYVNCWNQKEQESYLLWKNYSDLYSGISIKTTYGKIKTFFEYYSLDAFLFFGRINYGLTLYNRSQWSIPFTKREIYSEESEFRIVYAPLENEDDGIIIKGNVKLLVDELYLAPKMSEEMDSLIKEIIVGYGLNPDIVKKSEIFPKIDPMSEWQI